MELVSAQALIARRNQLHDQGILAGHPLRGRPQLETERGGIGERDAGVISPEMLQEAVTNVPRLAS